MDKEIYPGDCYNSNDNRPDGFYPGIEYPDALELARH